MNWFKPKLKVYEIRGEIFIEKDGELYIYQAIRAVPVQYVVQVDVTDDTNGDE